MVLRRKKKLKNKIFFFHIDFFFVNFKIGHNVITVVVEDNDKVFVFSF